MVKKEVDFKWSIDQTKAFETLKDKLIKAPLLVLPNFSKTFEIEFDASSVGIGAVLLQEDHPIAYFSEKLKGSHLNYSLPMIKSFMLLWGPCKLGNIIFYLKNSWSIVIMKLLSFWKAKENSTKCKVGRIPRAISIYDQTKTRKGQYCGRWPFKKAYSPFHAWNQIS